MKQQRTFKEGGAFEIFFFLLLPTLEPVTSNLKKGPSRSILTPKGLPVSQGKTEKA